ncbi:MAG: hypothetical protein M0P95_13925 [Sulfuritalea sp.]|nr:hypothetical protein [Sulfuritalea sp.]
MTMPRRFLLAGLLLAVLPPQASAGIGCDPLGYPEGAQVVVVADNLLFNGVPMANWELRWRESPERLRAFYRSGWEARGDRVVETEFGGWKTVATRDGECFYTVQTKAAAGGTYALIGVTRPPANAVQAQPGAGFPMLSGSKVVNDLQHKDKIRNARTLLLANSFSIDANASFYRNAMSGQGWAPTFDRAVRTERGESHVLIWKRGAEEASMTIGNGLLGSSVAVNFVDRP